MRRQKTKDPKMAFLQEEGTLNPHPEGVIDPLFGSGEFFDGRDLLQVKYEMLRQAKVEGKPISHCAASFGFSRPSFYEAQAAFSRSGLAGLLPRKRGPHGAHKLTPEVMSLIDEIRAKEETLPTTVLVKRIKEIFGVKVHPRSLERALRRRKKKRQ